MLLLAVPGGVALGVDRQTQRTNDLAYQGSVQEQDELRELKARLADFNRATAGQRDAQADAQAKANAAAQSAAASAQAADAAARASAAAASRSAPRPVPFG